MEAFRTTTLPTSGSSLKPHASIRNELMIVSSACAHEGVVSGELSVRVRDSARGKVLDCQDVTSRWSNKASSCKSLAGD